MSPNTMVLTTEIRKVVFGPVGPAGVALHLIRKGVGFAKDIFSACTGLFGDESPPTVFVGSR